MPKPTIAGVQGYCILAGWLVASTMDIIVAADDAQFLPEFVQYFTTPWDIGSRKAKEILYEGRFVDANEARQLGMVNEVVAPEDLETRVMEMANRFAETDLFRLRQIKQVVNGVEDIQGFRAAVDMAFLRNYHLHEARRADHDATPKMDSRPLERVERAKLRADRASSDARS